MRVPFKRHLASGASARTPHVGRGPRVGRSRRRRVHVTRGAQSERPTTAAQDTTIRGARCARAGVPRPVPNCPRHPREPSDSRNPMIRGPLSATNSPCGREWIPNSWLRGGGTMSRADRRVDDPQTLVRLEHDARAAHRADAHHIDPSAPDRRSDITHRTGDGSATPEPRAGNQPPARNSSLQRTRPVSVSGSQLHRRTAASAMALGSS